MQVKLVCTDLVALARSRPDRHSGNHKVGRSGMSPLSRFSPLEAGQKLPFGAGHLIALKLSERLLRVNNGPADPEIRLPLFPR